MRLRILALLYTLAIVTVTLLPSGGDTVVAGWDTRISPGVQNAMHLPAYVVLVALWMAAVGRNVRRPWLVLAMVTGGCMAFGVGSEWLQAAFVPGRYGSLTDALSNATGCLLGAGGWELGAGRWKLGVGIWNLAVGRSEIRTKSGGGLFASARPQLPTSNSQLPAPIGTILCLASGYEAPPTSKHHVMHVMAAEGHTVLWVNYHASRAPSATGSDLRHIARKLRQVAGGLTNPRNNVYVLTPLVVPLPASGLARRLNRAMLTWQIRRALRTIRKGNTPLELWSFTPDVAYLLGRFGEDRVVYYCVDDHSQFTGYNTRQVLRDEEALCRRADLVVTTSGPLQASRREWNPRTLLIPHGVDYDHFARALDANLPEPPELAAIPRPRLGFFGLLRDWVDLDLLAEVARRRPEWHIVLLGDSTVDLGPFRSMANMHFLGPKPYAELPAWCRGFDVGLIPFKLNPLTHAVNPIKLREYLAAGLPVVSTPMPEVIRYAREGVGRQVSGDRGGSVESDALPSECVSDEERKIASRTPFPPAWLSLADGPDAWTAALDAILLPEAAEAGSSEFGDRDPLTRSVERVSVSPTSSSQLPASASDRIARSAAMRSETWQAKVHRIREQLEGGR